MKSKSNSRRAYEQRVNQAIDYLLAHRSEQLTLEQIAGVACFSPYHFHRVFKAFTGETLGQFIQRTRLEWAASDLVLRPERSILETALDSGFNGAASFARAFKDRFGMNASAWRAGGAAEWGKARKLESNLGKPESKESKVSSRQLRDDPDDQAELDQQERQMNVTIKTLPRYEIAYLRHVGPYGAAGGIPALWQDLIKWAQTHDLWNDDALLIGISHDNPMVTEAGRLRYDAGIVVPEGFRKSGHINVAEMLGGKYAALRFKGTAQQIEGAWQEFFSGWLPGSGFQPDDRPCFELYRVADVDESQANVVVCDLCIPVRPL